MAVIIPNYQDSPSFPAMAERDRTDDFAARCAAQGTGVLSGMAVTQHTGSDMYVTVAAGQVSVQGNVSTYAGGTVGPFNAAGAGDRRDCVVLRSGSATILTGSVPTLLQAGGSGSGLVGAWAVTSTYVPPVKNDVVETTDCVLAEVYVAYNTTAITSGWTGTGNIVDKTNVIGALPSVVASKTTTYAILTTDQVVLCNASSGSFTATLPTAVGVTGKQYEIKKTDTSNYVVTVATTSSQTIDGFTTNVIAGGYESITVVSDGANWNQV